jgi:hypothetical protein
MKKLAILFLLVIFSQSLLSQTDKRLFLIGSEFGGAGANYKGVAPDYVNQYYSFAYFTPKFGYFINDNLLIGIQGGRSFYKTNYAPNVPTLYDLGFLARYYLPYSMKEIVTFKNKTSTINLEVTPYVEYNHLWTNTGPSRPGLLNINTGRHLDFQFINPNLGISFKVGKSFIIDFGYRLLFYDNNDGQKGFQFKGYGKKASIEYIIYQKKKRK